MPPRPRWPPSRPRSPNSSRPLDQTDEQYNQAVVNLSQTQTSLQTTTASLDAAKSQLAGARARLRVEAIEAYENDSAASAVASLFACPGQHGPDRATSTSRSAPDNLAADVARVQAGQRS